MFFLVRCFLHAQLLIAVVGDYKKAYPEAKLIAPQAAIERHNDPDLKFDGAWGRDPVDTKYGFEDDIEHLYVRGDFQQPQ